MPKKQKKICGVSLVVGGGSPWQGRVSLVGGCLLGRGGLWGDLQGSLISRGSPWWGVLAEEGLLGRGVSLAGGCSWQGGCHARHAGIPPPPVNRMTNKCKNITLPQTSFAGGNKFIHCTLPKYHTYQIRTRLFLKVTVYQTLWTKWSTSIVNPNFFTESFLPNNQRIVS